MAALAALVALYHAGCTITQTCEPCRQFDATEWCAGAGAGQCTSSKPTCAPGASNASCLLRFEATSQMQSLVVPVSSIKPEVDGLAVVDIHLSGSGPLDITPSTGSTQFAWAFNGMPATCTEYATNDDTQVYLRCPVPPDLAVMQFVCKQSSTSFSLSVTFTEPNCGSPMNPCR